MKQLRQLGVSVACGVLLLTSCTRAYRTERQVDELFASWNHPNTPGVALVIIKDGRVVCQRCYGCADLEHNVPITQKTVFDIGSTSKQFTGLAIAMLAEQGKLSLDDDIRKYVPYVPDFGSTITVRHLLYHTSGLRDWGDMVTLSGRGMGDLHTMDVFVEMVKRQRELNFSPGEKHLYCNTGYILLADIVARVSGQPFRAWLETNVFQPLQMEHTCAGDNAAEVIPNRAECYGPKAKAGWEQSASQLAVVGSGHILTTAEDMAKWLLNLESARVGGRKVMDAMFQSGKLNNGTRIGYGYGFFLGDYRGTKMIEHGGDWQHYHSEVLYLPEKRFAVAILSNAGNVNSDGLQNLSLKIADWYLGLAPPPAPPAKQAATGKVDPAMWGAYVGTYWRLPRLFLEITRDGEQLMVQATGETKCKMTPVSERSFFVEAYGQPIEFVRDAAGEVTHLVYRGAQAPKLKLPPITPEYLSAFVGDYWSEEFRVVYRVELREGCLQVWHPVAGWTKLLPYSTNRFDGPFGIAMTFEKDAASRVNGFRCDSYRNHRITFVRISLPQPGLAFVDPNPLPVGTNKATITYLAANGPLTGANRVLVHRGYDGWRDTSDLEMKRLEADKWWITLDAGTATNRLDFCFTDGTNWDNNVRLDWHLRRH